MNILLINTPSLPIDYREIKKLSVSRQERISVAPPLGICYLSSYLKSKGHNVILLDLEVELYSLHNYTIDVVFDLINKIMDKIDLVGVSCLMSTRYKQAHDIAKIVKSIKNIPIVFGGNYPTNSPELALKDDNVDFVVLGEGEKVFYNLLCSLKEPERVSGIAYKSDGIKINPKQNSDFIQDLDNIPFPDYGSLSIDKYFSLGMSQSLEGNFRFFSIFTSRGCPKNCIFCGSHNTFGRRFRARSKQNVLDEVDWLIRNYQVEELQFQDDNLTLDRKRVEEILGGIKERNIPWTIPNGLDTNTLDRDLLEKIKQSGGRDICIAVESGNQRVLEMIHKHINLEKIKRLIKDMRDLGIYSKAFFMLGFPGETKKEMYDTVNYAFILRADWTMFSIVNPLPGTEMHKIAKDYIVGDMDNIGYSNANLKTEEFTPEEVENLVDKANININFIYNYNLNGGNINWAIRDFKRISERYPGHIVARESLKKAYEGLYSSRVRN